MEQGEKSQQDATGRGKQLPVPLRARMLPAHPPEGRLPVITRRVGALVRAGARNPTVVASATAILTVAAEVGVRLLQQEAVNRRPRPLPPTPAPRATSMRISETWTVTRVTEIRRSE